MIKIALADDQVLFLNGMRLIIDSFENMDLIIEAENGQQLIDKLKYKTPDVLLLDLKMPIMDGEEVTKYLKIHYPNIKILLLTMYDDDRLINHLMELGANGYLLKNDPPEEVREAIKTVFKKDFYFNDRISKALLSGIKNKGKTFTNSGSINGPVSLTKRELEILKLICQQMTTAEIAQQLFISVRTVEGHRKNLLEKTGSRNSAGLVIFAYKNNMID